jgi:autotransporter-associated beta strand protein
MNFSNRSRSTGLALCAVFTSYATAVSGASGTWQSTNTVYGSSAWTNSYNWSASPYPSAAQTATFSGSGNGRTVIDLDGLSSISNITFSGTGAAAYTLGAGGPDAQTLTLSANGILQLASSVANPQRVDAKIQLGPDAAAGSYSVRNDSSTYPLTLAGGAFHPGSGASKALTFLGNGTTVVSGNILSNGVNTLTVTNAGPGHLALAGASDFTTYVAASGATTFSGANLIRYAYLNNDAPLFISGSNSIGTLYIYGTGATAINILEGFLSFTGGGGLMIRAEQNAVINGPGKLVVAVGTSSNLTGDNYCAPGKTVTVNADITGFQGLELWSGSGTWILNGRNDFQGNLSMGPATVVCAKIGMKGATDSNLGSGTTVTLASSTTKLVYIGTGETTDRIFAFSGSGVTLDQSGTGHLVFTGIPTISSGNKTLVLQGSTAGTAEFASAIPNSSTLSLLKNGTGTWILSANNTLAGTTTVNGGTLALRGNTVGKLGSSTAYVINAGGTLLLDNTTLSNSTDRLRNASPVTLNGGTLTFANDGGDADFSEAAGELSVSAGASTVTASRAAAARTSAFTFASLSHADGATVNFAGPGLGDPDNRNRILITSQADGPLPGWVTVNGLPAAYTSSRGVYAADGASYTAIPARGPSTLPDTPAAPAIISTDGTDGPIDLAAPLTRVSYLYQDTATPATLDTADKALQTDAIIIPAGKAPVTVGQAPSDGTLAPVTAGGTLTLSSSGGALTVNAALVDNTSASSLYKIGTGTATLASAGTLSGTVSVSGGTLTLGHADALAFATLASGVSFGNAIGAFNIGALSGTFDQPLEDAASAAVSLSVSDGAFSGTLSGSGALVKVGPGTLALSSANTHAGGTAVEAGTLSLQNSAAAGTGPVTDNATLSLAVVGSDVTYPFPSLSGSGTVLAPVGSGSNINRFPGDFSAFTGTWFVGTNAGGRILFNGPDASAATLIVATNSQLIAYPGTGDNIHRAHVILYGGDPSDTYGNLRIDNGVEWAGPVTLRGPMTDEQDGTLGNGSGTAVVSGVIGDDGLGIGLSKSHSGAMILTASNTFSGPVWVKNGTLGVPRIGAAAAGYAPLGNQPDADTAALALGRLTSTGTLNYLGNGETTDREIRLAGTTGGAGLYHNGTNTLTFTGNITSVTAGNKRLTLAGDATTGTGVLAGVFSDYASSTNNLYKNGWGTWRLEAANTFKGAVEIRNGNLVVAHSQALGIGPKNVSANNNATEAGSRNLPHIVLDGSAADLTIPADITFRTSSQVEGAIINAAGDNTILGNINLTSGDGDTIVNSAAGRLTLAGRVYPPTDTNRRLRFWGDGDGEVSGIISNGATAALPVWKEQGTGTWTLTGPNTHTGLTSSDAGTLVIGGSDGRVGGPAGATLSGTLAVSNAPDANLSDRLPDAAAVTLSNGGTFRFLHAGGDADYAEAAGTLTVAGTNACFVTASCADVGRTSALTFASLARTAPATLDFSGDGLGLDDRNRVIITAQPDGLIGLWATYNGAALAAYSAASGVVAAGSDLVADLPAKGPADIPDDASKVARIATEGTNGPITLAAATVSLKGLLQDSAWDSTVALPGKALLADDVRIASGKAALTLGASRDEGTLAPLTSGGTLSLINDSASTLTVNATLTNNAAASSLTTLGAVTLSGAPRHTGPTLISAGDLTVDVAATTTNALAGAVSGPGNLVKTGAGALALNTANSSFSGTLTVSGGTLQPKNNASLGATAGGTVIEAGATLDLGTTAYAAQGVNFNRERFIVSGAGVGGRGAIVNSSNLSQYNALHDVVLADDATFGGEQAGGRFDIRSTGTFDMGGHTLTKVGANLFSITSIDVANPGNVDLREGSFRLETSAKLNGDAANTLTLRSGARFESYNLATPVPWSLDMENNATFAAVQGNTAALNIWSGPATLGGTALFDSGGYSATLAGDLSGPGRLLKSGNGTLYLTGKNNTYSGGTTLSNGTLRIYNPGGLPNFATPGAFTASPATVVTNALILYSGDGTTGWTGAQLDALLATAPFNSTRSTFGLDTTAADIDHALTLSGAMAFAQYGSGTLVQRGPVNITGTLNLFNSGVLDFGPDVSATVTGNTYVNDTSTLFLTNNNTYAANAFVVEESGRLYLGSGSTLTLPASQDFHVRGSQNAKAFIDGTLTAARDLCIARNASGDRATLVVSGTVTAAHLFAGHNGTGRAGAVIQNGGVMHIGTNTTSAPVFAIGNQGSYGYLQLNGGETRTGQFSLSDNSTSGDYRNTAAVADFNGGALTLTKSGGWIIHGWNGGYGAFNIRGGTVSAPAGANDTTLNYAADRGAYGLINLLGPDGLLDATGYGNDRGVDLARSAGNQAGFLNLNGGTLLANTVRAGSTATPTFINFGGGTLLARPTTTKAATFLQGITYATVYPGGAVIDSSNATLTVAQNLQAPEGYGLAAIPLASGGAGYIGAPFVVITGGSGTGATAVADVDLALGQVTALTVTSPGFGYQPGDTLVAALRGGGFTSPALVSLPVLAPNSLTGGLTKLGSGTLTLGGANTYGGATVVREGTLKLASPLALPAHTDVTLAAGTTLDLNGSTVTNTVSGQGTVSNGTLVTVISPAGENALGTETLTLSSATLQGTYLADVTAGGASDHLTLNGNVNLAGLTLHLVAPEALNRNTTYTIAKLNGTWSGTLATDNLPDPRWHTNVLSDGTVRLLFVEGTIIFLR